MTTILENVLARSRQPSLLAGDLRLAWNRLRRPGIVTVQGIRIPLGDHLTPFIRDTLYSGNYEYHEARLLRRFLQPHHTVVELGGGLGFLAATCCRIVPSQRVFVYEANPELETVLRETFRLSGVAPTLNMCALGAGAGEMKFFIREAFWLSSGQHNAMVEPEREVRVEVRDFDQEMDTLPRRPDFLICDIEGGEYGLFTGSELAGIRRILCEVHPHLLSDAKVEVMRNVLNARGFCLRHATADGTVWYLERE